MAERVVREKLAARAGEIASLVPNVRGINPEIVELRESIKILSAINDPDLTEVIERKKTKLHLLQETEEIKTVESQEKGKLLEMVVHPGFWDGMIPSDRNAIYRDLIEVVWCDRGKLEVVPYN